MDASSMRTLTPRTDVMGKALFKKGLMDRSCPDILIRVLKWNKEYPLHRLILLSQSDYFDKKLTVYPETLSNLDSNQQEPTNATQEGNRSRDALSEKFSIMPMELEFGDDVVEDGFQFVVNYLYGDPSLTLTPRNIFEVVHSAFFFQVEALIAECSDYLKENISAHSCAAILRWAQDGAHGSLSNELIQACQEYLLFCMPQEVQKWSGRYSQLDSRTLIDTISSLSLAVASAFERYKLITCIIADLENETHPNECPTEWVYNEGLSIKGRSERVVHDINIRNTVATSNDKDVACICTEMHAPRVTGILLPFTEGLSIKATSGVVFDDTNSRSVVATSNYGDVTATSKDKDTETRKKEKEKEREGERTKRRKITQPSSESENSALVQCLKSHLSTCVEYTYMTPTELVQVQEEGLVPESVLCKAFCNLEYMRGTLMGNNLSRAGELCLENLPCFTFSWSISLEELRDIPFLLKIFHFAETDWEWTVSDGSPGGVIIGMESRNLLPTYTGRHLSVTYMVEAYCSGGCKQGSVRKSSRQYECALHEWKYPDITDFLDLEDENVKNCDRLTLVFAMKLHVKVSGPRVNN